MTLEELNTYKCSVIIRYFDSMSSEVFELERCDASCAGSVVGWHQWRLSFDFSVRVFPLEPAHISEQDVSLCNLVEDPFDVWVREVRRDAEIKRDSVQS